MTIYTGSMFETAQLLLAIFADFLQIPNESRARLLIARSE